MRSEGVCLPPLVPIQFLFKERLHAIRCFLEQWFVARNSPLYIVARKEKKLTIVIDSTSSGARLLLPCPIILITLPLSADSPPSKL